MERPPKQEQAPRIDFLDDSVNLSLRFESEASKHMPVIYTEDLESRLEKYRILLGRVEVYDEEVKVVITGILEMRDEPLFYEEEKEAVSGVNIHAIKQFIGNYHQAYPEDKDSFLVGDIHTHPILPKDFEDGLDPWVPSTGDVESIVADYEQGVCSRNEPFIFGIAGPDEDGETHYAFYRLVYIDGEYRVKGVGLE